MPRTAHFGLVERGQKDCVLAINGLGHQILLFKLRVDSLEDGGFGDLQQLHGHGDQLVSVGGAVALIGPLLQGMPDAGLGANEGVGRDTQPLSQCIGGLEADAVDVEGQTVGVFRDLDVDTHCPRGAQPMGLEKDHDLADDLLFGPSTSHALLALGTDAVQFQQAFRGLFDDVKHRFAEGAHQLLGKVRADALDHAGAKVFLDTLQRGGWHDLQLGGLELQAMGTIIDPDAQTFDVFARCDRGGQTGAVIRSRCPRTLMRRTQNPLASL